MGMTMTKQQAATSYDAHDLWQKDKNHFPVDGEGTLITTEECLLNPNRNPEMSHYRALA